MKTIDTLVEDIYELFNPKTKVELKEEDLNAFAKSVVSSVASALAGREDKRNLRLSMIGQPNRKVWYEVTGGKKQDLEPQTLIKFLYGDMLEQLLVLLVKAAGHSVEDAQKEVVVNGVVGHQDAVVDGVLVDFKSASDYGFKKFKEGTVAEDDPFGYVAQLSAYAAANKTNKAGWLAINKTTGELSYCPLHAMDFIDSESRVDEVKKLATQKEPPPRCYDAVPDGKSGNMRLAIGCSYCDFKLDCWKDSNNGRGLRTFNYSTGKKSFVKVAYEPNVPEILDEQV